MLIRKVLKKYNGNIDRSLSEVRKTASVVGSSRNPRRTSILRKISLTRLEREVQLLSPWHDEALRAGRRTTVGPSGLTPERMGEAAREQVQRSHGPDRFRVEFTRAVREARKKWVRRSSNVIVGSR